MSKNTGIIGNKRSRHRAGGDTRCVILRNRLAGAAAQKNRPMDRNV